MSGWVKVKEGHVTIEHYSTSSQMVITVYDGHEAYETWLDYAEFNDLQKCMSQIAEILNH